MKTVLVTAIGSFSADAVIKACRREGFRVVGCDIYPALWLVSAMDVDAFYRAPRAAERQAYREFLKEVCRQEGVDLLLPLTDVEVDVLKDWPEAEECLGAAVCMSDRDTVKLCRDKGRLERFLADRKLCRTIPGRSLKEVLDSLDGADGAASDAAWGPGKLPYPLILKPCDGRSSQGLRVVEDAEGLRYAAECCRDEAARYLVQPKIPGDVVTVDVVRDLAGGACACLPRRELLRTLNGAGLSVEVFRNVELEGQCRAIAEALHIRGCVNFEFIAAETGWYFLECNPRFSGGVAFSCMAGYDMVKNHLSCFLGREPEPMGDIKNQYLARRYVEYRTDNSEAGPEVNQGK